MGVGCCVQLVMALQFCAVVMVGLSPLATLRIHVGRLPCERHSGSLSSFLAGHQYKNMLK